MTRSGLAAFLLVTCGAGVSLAQPITFPTSMSVGERDLYVRVQPWYVRSSDDPSGRGRQLTELNLRVVCIYGITRNTALFVTAPYVLREWKEGGRRSRHTGFADVELLLRRTVFEMNVARRTFSISPIAGLKLPTGGDTGDGIPRSYALASGALDAILGFAVRDAAVGKPHRFLASRFTFRTESGGYRRGNAFEADVAIKPVLGNWNAGAGAVGLNGMLEVNYLREGAHRRTGKTVSDTGGTILSLTPGVVLTTHRWILEMAVRVPLIQDLNGDALRNDYAVLIGVWHNF